MSRLASFSIILLTIMVCSISPVAAEDKKGSLLWMQNRVAFLTGTGFELPGHNMTTLSLEHVSRWSWGDIFSFADLADYHDNPNRNTNWYGEFNPRISLGRTVGLGFSEGGAVKDMLLAFGYERGRGGVKSLLAGVGADLKIPTFSMFQVNVYARKDIGLDAGFDDMQVTVAWLRPFKIGEQKFLFDGFADYVAGWGPKAENIHIVPQLKWDMGAVWDRPGRFYMGTEIDIWRNQFGVKNRPGLDTNQVAINFLLAAYF